MQRCGWVSQDPLYIEYHDTEWGVAQKEGRQLFEMICLEGQPGRFIVDHGVKKTAELPPGFSPVRSGARGSDG